MVWNSLLNKQISNNFYSIFQTQPLVNILTYSGDTDERLQKSTFIKETLKKIKNNIYNDEEHYRPHKNICGQHDSPNRFPKNKISWSGIPSWDRKVSTLKMLYKRLLYWTVDVDENELINNTEVNKLTSQMEYEIIKWRRLPCTPLQVHIEDLWWQHS